MSLVLKYQYRTRSMRKIISPVRRPRCRRPLAAAVFGSAHQQRRRRRGRSRDQPAVHDPDQRHQPSCHNANDAVSEAQTTAGALNTIVNNLQSIRTLAVEAANGSNSASDRSALNNQVQQQIRGNHPDRAADHVQRLERAQRLERHHRVPSGRECRRHHCGELAAGRGGEPDRSILARPPAPP